MIYFISFVLILFIVGFSEGRFEFLNDSILLNKLTIRVGMIISFVILFLIAALRKDVGIDYGVYSNLQFPSTLAGNYETVEPLSTLIILLGDFLGGYQVIFALFHLIILSLVITSIYQNTPNKTLALFFLFFTGYYNASLNLMRQSISIAIFLFSLKFIEERKLFKFLVCMIFAFLFHKTAIMYVPLYFLYVLPFTKKYLSIVLILGLSSIFLVEPVLRLVTTVFDVYRNYWGATEMSSTNRFSGTYWVLNMLILIVMIIVIEFAKREQTPIPQSIYFYFYVQLLVIGIMCFSMATYVPNFDRILTNFSYAQIIFLPKYFSLKINQKVHLFLLILVCLIFILSFIQLIVIKNIGGTFPYQTIFS